MIENYYQIIIFMSIIASFTKISNSKHHLQKDLFLSTYFLAEA